MNSSPIPEYLPAVERLLGESFRANPNEHPDLLGVYMGALSLIAVARNDAFAEYQAGEEHVPSGDSGLTATDQTVVSPQIILARVAETREETAASRREFNEMWRMTVLRGDDILYDRIREVYGEDLDALSERLSQRVSSSRSGDWFEERDFSYGTIVPYSLVPMPGLMRLLGVKHRNSVPQLIKRLEKRDNTDIVPLKLSIRRSGEGVPCYAWADVETIYNGRILDQRKDRRYKTRAQTSINIDWVRLPSATSIDEDLDKVSYAKASLAAICTLKELGWEPEDYIASRERAVSFGIIERIAGGTE